MGTKLTGLDDSQILDFGRFAGLPIAKAFAGKRPHPSGCAASAREKLCECRGVTAGAAMG